jgi:hypothetical protein
MQDRQQISGVGGHGRAVRDEAPSREVSFKHRSLILGRYLVRAGQIVAGCLVFVRTFAPLRGFDFSSSPLHRAP